MASGVNVAVVGAAGVSGEPLLDTLEARKFPVDTLYCLDEGEAVGERLRRFGKSVTVASIADFDFSQVGLVFFCSEEVTASRYAQPAVEAGCTVIDCSGAFSAEDDVPLVIPEINPEAMADCRQYPIIANPSPATIALLLVLKPLHEAAGIERVNLTSFEPVSVAGKAGVEELASQTVALLNMKEAGHRVFPQQIAFNALPSLGTMTDSGYTDAEIKLLWETQKVLPQAGIKLNPTAVLVPVFYGHSLVVHLETRGYLSAGEARAILREAPRVTLHEAGVPTPVAETANGETVHVGRLREDISHPQGIDLWITVDSMRAGLALNAVQIAELWEKCYT